MLPQQIIVRITNHMPQRTVKSLYIISQLSNDYKKVYGNSNL